MKSNLGYISVVKHVLTIYKDPVLNLPSEI